MPQPTFERLPPQDSAFLLWENRTTHMHVAATMIFEAAPLRTPEGGIDIDRVRDFIASRLHRIPRYRQVLAYAPVDRQPVWVDDEHFNLHYHVRHTSLPRPGTEEQLKRLSGRIFSQQLDRTKPLWEFWVVEGLEGGEQFAAISKVHHCMVDGLAGVDLMMALMTLEPVRELEDAPRFIPRRSPSKLALLSSEVRHRAGLPLRALGALTRPDEQLGRALDRLGQGVRTAAEFIGAGLRGTSDTPLNRPIGPHRRFDWVRVELERVKAVKNSLGGTVNDVVLATTAGAVRRFLEDRRVAPDTVRFRALAPVSLRSPDERGALGNRVSAWFVDLPIGEPDPRRRLLEIRETTARLKESDQALGADALAGVSEWTGSTLLSLGARLITLLRPFNLVVTNVPGPQVPLYLLGGRLVASYPHVPLFGNQALGIALFSYAGWLCWGFNADWDLLADLDRFVAKIEESFAELEAAAGVSRRRGTREPTLPAETARAAAPSREPAREEPRTPQGEPRTRKPSAPAGAAREAAAPRRPHPQPHR